MLFNAVKLHLLQMGVTRTLYPIWLGLLKIKNNYNDEKTSCETRCPYDLVHFTHRRSGVSAIFPMQPATYSSYGFVSYDFIIQSYENIFNHFTKNLQKTFLIKRIEYYNIFLIFLFTIFLLKSTILFISIYDLKNISENLKVIHIYLTILSEQSIIIYLYSKRRTAASEYILPLFRDSPLIFGVW